MCVWMLRFKNKNNALRNQLSMSGKLSGDEVKEAEMRVIKSIQAEFGRF